MSLPTIAVRIGFDTFPLANPQVWTDVSSDAISFHISKGRQNRLDRIEAGTAQITLRNDSGDYWSASASEAPYDYWMLGTSELGTSTKLSPGAYYSDVLPGKAVNIRATYNGTTYDLYYGFIESWTPAWLSEGGLAPVVTIECVDLIKNLAIYEITSAGYAQELSGTRIENVLTSYGWDTTLSDLDTGQSTIIATGALTSANAMEHVFTVMDTERGQFFIAGDGHPQFQDRHARLTTPLDTSQATYGDDVGELSYRDIGMSYDDTFIYNNIKITRLGGTVQTADDTISQTTFGIRSLSKDNLLMTTDLEALSQAQYLLSLYKEAPLRCKALTIYPQRDEANLFPDVLGFDISTRITVRLNQATLDKEFHIEGISHDYDARDGSWITNWQLSDADSASSWILDTAALDIDTRLIY